MPPVSLAHHRQRQRRVQHLVIRYQQKTGHALTGLYLKWIGSREDDTCRCRPGVTQTHEHLFKVCTAWRKQPRTAPELPTCSQTNATDLGREAREEEWERVCGDFMEEDDESVEVEVEAELTEGEEDDGDLL